MQFTIKPETPAEVRLVAAFLQDHADFMEASAPEEAPAKPARTKTKAKAEPAAAAEPEPAAAAEPEPAAAAEQVISVDDLRKLFGDLSQNGKREEAIAVVRGYGFNAIKDITEEKRNEIHAKLVAL